jgi:hypothetical protein
MMMVVNIYSNQIRGQLLFKLVLHFSIEFTNCFIIKEVEN